MRWALPRAYERFPAQDVMMGAPGTVEQKQRGGLHIAVTATEE